jgi:hypothetical protein
VTPQSNSKALAARRRALVAAILAARTDQRRSG